MALEFAKDDLEYIKETLEWLSEHTVLIEDNRTNCETEHSRIQNSLIAIERGLAQCSDENAALPLQSVSTRYFVVGYIGTMHTGQLTGSVNMWSESGYLTRARATQVIEEYNEGINNVVITNVTELNKEDFEAWRANVR